jgi:hypothetical protein
MRCLLLVVAGLGLAACEPRAGVTMTGDGGGYQLQFENCTRPGQKLPVSRVEIRSTSAGAEDAPLCSLDRTGTGQPLTDSWRYGEAVPGYEMRGCTPLEPGGAYRIQVSLGPVAADAEVTVDEGGALRAEHGGCS